MAGIKWGVRREEGNGGEGREGGERKIGKRRMSSRMEMEVEGMAARRSRGSGGSGLRTAASQ